ncbi:MAG: DUF1015 domain-containing protein [Candidatus Binataceae bacterium]
MTQLGNRIEPFRALMFNFAIVGDPARVTAPPYDLIDEARQNELYERSPYNVVRLEYARGPAGLGDKSRYSAAKATLAEWTAAGVLVRAPRPAIYHYRQSFEVAGRKLSRTGLIVRIRLEEFTRGRILPHERTFPAAKEDRLKLLTAIEVNTSSIFGLYGGAHPELEKLNEVIAAREPAADFIDELQIRNELRPIESPAEIAAIQRELDSPRILIADGHHRYETALNYRRARRAQSDSPALQPFDYTMMTLVACGDPGLVVLPTHRVVKWLPAEAIASFRDRAQETFGLEEIADADTFRARLAESGRGAIGVSLRGERAHFILRLRDRAAMIAALPDSASEVRELDVSILHALVFDRIFRLKAEEIKKGGNIDYTIDAAGAIEAVAAGRAAGAFLMNAPTIGDIEQVSDAGATMPEKSTYFFPKLLTGLAMNPLAD